MVFTLLHDPEQAKIWPSFPLPELPDQVQWV